MIIGPSQSVALEAMSDECNFVISIATDLLDAGLGCGAAVCECDPLMTCRLLVADLHDIPTLSVMLGKMLNPFYNM